MGTAAHASSVMVSFKLALKGSTVRWSIEGDGDDESFELIMILTRLVETRSNLSLPTISERPNGLTLQEAITLTGITRDELWSLSTKAREREERRTVAITKDAMKD